VTAIILKGITSVSQAAVDRCRYTSRRGRLKNLWTQLRIKLPAQTARKANSILFEIDDINKSIQNSNKG